MSLETLEAPTIRIPSEVFKNTPTIEAKNRAVVALSNTVTNTTAKTNGVIYSAPTNPFNANFDPKSEAIPAATIPLGPTQLIKSFSLNFKEEPIVLTNTESGLSTKMIIANKIAVFQL